MKKFGLIGGIGPESTAKYYQLIIQEFRQRLKTNEYPEFLIRSINMTEMLSYIFNNEFEKLTDFLLSHLRDLEHSGVEFAAMASNTPHIVFDQLDKRSKIQLISIVRETCKKIQSEKHSNVGLFGTKSTMKEGFYNQAAKEYGINIVTPKELDIEFIHEKYFDELVFNKINSTTKQRLIEIALNMNQQYGIQGLILGGTELSLILNQSDFPDLRIYDTTQIHVESIVSEMIEG